VLVSVGVRWCLLQCVSVCMSVYLCVLHCAAVCCSVLQCVAVCCSAMYVWREDAVMLTRRSMILCVSLYMRGCLLVCVGVC